MRRRTQEKVELSLIPPCSFGDLGCGSVFVSFQVSNVEQFI